MALKPMAEWQKNRYFLPSLIVLPRFNIASGVIMTNQINLPKATYWKSLSTITKVNKAYNIYASKL